MAEGYAELYTGRHYLVHMGDWRKDKDEEVELDGIGGVNIIVKADVHRAGRIFFASYFVSGEAANLCSVLCRHQLPLLRVRKPG